MVFGGGGVADGDKGIAAYAGCLWFSADIVIISNSGSPSACIHYLGKRISVFHGNLSLYV